MSAEPDAAARSLYSHWTPDDRVLSRTVSRGVVLSAGYDDHMLLIHPGDVVWRELAAGRSVEDTVDALQHDGATEAEARSFTTAVIDDLSARGFLHRGP